MNVDKEACYFCNLKYKNLIVFSGNKIINARCKMASVGMGGRMGKRHRVGPMVQPAHATGGRYGRGSTMTRLSSLQHRKP